MLITSQLFFYDKLLYNLLISINSFQRTLQSDHAKNIYRNFLLKFIIFHSLRALDTLIGDKY